MDNLCHTLVGAALGEAGLKRRTRYANAVLMISANLPDIDVLVFATETLPVSFRRGWTHGIAAQLLLPVVLTGAAMVIGGRSRGRTPDVRTDRAHPVSSPPLDAAWLLALSYIGVYSHVFLDYLNNYGVRLLAPFNWRWFYGDAVFIIDPWLWLALAAGIWLARRWRSPLSACAALLAAACYVAVMLAAARTGRDLVISAWVSERGAAPRAVMVGPVAFTALEREVIVDAGDRYAVGRLAWWPAGVTFSPETTPKNDDHPDVAAAIAVSEGVREFLVWSRFPFWTLEPAEHGTRVTVGDMRFRFRGRGFAVTTVVPSDP
jgi:inner membrane protein